MTVDINEFIAKETERTQKALSGHQTPYDTLGDYVENWLRDVYGCMDDAVVGIKMKYSHERKYTRLNVIYSCDGVWKDDWYEGQQEVYLVGIIPVSEVETFMTDTTGNDRNFYAKGGE